MYYIFIYSTKIFFLENLAIDIYHFKVNSLKRLCKLIVGSNLEPQGCSSLSWHIPLKKEFETLVQIGYKVSIL